MERLRKEEEAISVARDKEQLEQTVHSQQQELAEKQDMVLSLQVRGCVVVIGVVITYMDMYLTFNPLKFLYQEPRYSSLLGPLLHAYNLCLITIK